MEFEVESRIHIKGWCTLKRWSYLSKMVITNSESNIYLPTFLQRDVPVLSLWLIIFTLSASKIRQDIRRTGSCLQFPSGRAREIIKKHLQLEKKNTTLTITRGKWRGDAGVGNWVMNFLVCQSEHEWQPFHVLYMLIWSEFHRVL